MFLSLRSHLSTPFCFFQRRTIIDPNNRDLVHHLVLMECNPTAVFDDKNLPEGLCDNISQSISSCFLNLASVWAVGGDEVIFSN